jgi:hypothetical protein
MADVKVGDRVWFVPGMEHAFTRDAAGKHQFAFRHAEDAPARLGYHGHRKGDLVNLDTAGKLQSVGKALRTGQGHTIEPHAPICFWPAWVVEVLPDGSVCLDVIHPHGYKDVADVTVREKKYYRTDHIPDRSIHPNAAGVPYDARKQKPHSFHLTTD